MKKLTASLAALLLAACTTEPADPAQPYRDALPKAQTAAIGTPQEEGGAAGAPMAWENPDSGRRGTIVPGPQYDRRGARCRDYTHTIYIDGRPQVARGAACRNPDGSWTPVA